MESCFLQFFEGLETDAQYVYVNYNLLSKFKKRDNTKSSTDYGTYKLYVTIVDSLQQQCQC